jgi:hypothetical protein
VDQWSLVKAICSSGISGVDIMRVNLNRGSAPKSSTMFDIKGLTDSGLYFKALLSPFA